MIYAFLLELRRAGEDFVPVLNYSKLCLPYHPPSDSQERAVFARSRPILDNTKKLFIASSHDGSYF